MKAVWDVMIIGVLIFSSLTIPYRVAFVDSDTTSWKIVNSIVDGCFFIDILVIFNSAYYNEDYELIESRKKIAIKYLKSWFMIDLISILPVEYMLRIDSLKYNELLRIVRIGRMYKLVKLTRLIRILKFGKSKSKFIYFITVYLKISQGFQRLFLFLCGFFLTCHIVSCLWVVSAQMAENLDDTWMTDFDENLYLTSFYFTVTTITTVGYGDISGNTSTEKIFCILIMVVGVISFSFASGSLASIMQNYDSKNAVL
jgi:hypothetical protein